MLIRTHKWIAAAAVALVSFLSPMHAATVNLAWVAPALNNDGSALAAVAGYKVYVGTTSKSYTRVIETTANQVTVTGLPDGQRSYFTVTARTASQVEGAMAPELVVDTPASLPPSTTTIPSNISMGEALDNPTLQFKTGGDQPWLTQATGALDGGDAVKSGAIGALQQSWVETTVTGPGSFSFWWRVSSEENHDRLRFQVGDAEQASISGAVTWEHRSVSIPAGTHTLRWTYATDGGGTAGANVGWLDTIVWLPQGGMWAGAWDFGNGWKYTKWFGYFYTAHQPWIYHEHHGWLYARGETPESIIFWDSKASLYWWTSSLDYPELYRYRDNAWLTYSTESPSPRWFYNLQSSAWESW